jgi:hypothetical protein
MFWVLTCHVQFGALLRIFGYFFLQFFSRYSPSQCFCELDIVLGPEVIAVNKTDEVAESVKLMVW